MTGATRHTALTLANDGDLDVTGDTTLGSSQWDDLTVNATSTFNHAVTVIGQADLDGGISVSEGLFSVDHSNGNTVVEGTLNTYGSTTLMSTLVTGNISAYGEGSNQALTINAKGSGTITLGDVSTGAITLTPATTITGILTANAGIDVDNSTFDTNAITTSGIGTGFTINTLNGGSADGNITLNAGNGNINTTANTFAITGAQTVSGTLGVSGAITTSMGMTLGGSLTVSTGGIYVTTGGLSVTAGGAYITTGGLTVAAGGAYITNGGLTIAAGGETVHGGLAVTSGSTSLDGGLSMDTDKFTVADGSGDVVTAGTLTVGGNTTFTGNLAVNGGSITTTASTFSLANAATTLNIGSTNGVSRSINIGTATNAAQYVTLGSTYSNSSVAINAGSGGIILTGPVAGGSSDTITPSSQAISVNTLVTFVNTTDGAITATLADGVTGQIKYLVMNSGSNPMTLGNANMYGSSLVLDAVGEAATLVFDGSKWSVSGTTGAYAPDLP
ncbi:MAG: hypothetical protein NTW50_02695 [Candidatus Berkelbacteria bacterium]|nr:hypothetical protein [Candidatus Berkelbacteria bacterium]